MRLPAHALTDRFAAAVLAAPVVSTDTTGMLRPVRATADVVAHLRDAAATGWPSTGPATTSDRLTHTTR